MKIGPKDYFYSVFQQKVYRAVYIARQINSSLFQKRSQSNTRSSWNTYYVIQPETETLFHTDSNVKDLNTILPLQSMGPNGLGFRWIVLQQFQLKPNSKE